MAVFSDKDLENAMEEDGDIIILNMCEENKTAVGYDLAIGFICDSDTGERPETYAEDTNRYILLPGHRYLVISKEFLYLPPRCMATLHSRISYALKGILITSTVIDPNYIGFVMGSLFNCTSEEIYIKKDNSFITMVIHEFRTPTKTFLRKNDQNAPKDALATLYSKYPNISEKAREAAVIHWTKARGEIEYEFEAAKELMHEKRQREIVSLPENERRTRITFLIGNGFDLNVGLDTRYVDFCKYYVNRRKNALSKEIEKNFEAWSYLELALGQCTENIQDKGTYWECETDLEECLLNYLEEQMKRIDITDKQKQREIGFKMRYSLTDFYESFPNNIKLHIEKILSDDNKQIEYSFITFNYTDALEKCLEAAKEQCMDGFWPEIDKMVLHIHGTTKSRDIVLGVNDESQIADKEYRNNRSDRQRFIKEEIIDHNGNENKEKACKIIDSSSIICIFGMSIGATDKMWWQYIAKWLQNNRDRRLIIFAKDWKTNSISKYDNDCENDMKNKFKYNGELAVVWKEIETQIYVKVNADIFDFKIV